MKVRRDQLEWIASKSFSNCHAEGVDSLLFDDTPGARVRAFICRPNHTLWRNDVSADGPMSVGLHPHHCSISIHSIFGDAFNVVDSNRGGWRHWLNEFSYESAITGSQGRFVPTGVRRQFRLYPGRIIGRIDMSALDLHTIYVPKGEEAAWFVYEGADDPRYKPCAWSNDDLANLDFSGLYRPMSIAQVEEAICRMGIELAEETPCNLAPHTY